MLKDAEEQIKFIKENYSEVSDSRYDENHWDLYCPRCKVVRGFQVVKKEYTAEFNPLYRQYDIDFKAPRTIYFRCPACGTYKMWLVFEFAEEKINKKGGKNRIQRIYKITSIPGEGLEDIVELPLEPASLRTAYRQAIRSMDANAHIAAAAMFRRALQIITREILEIKPGNLARELKELVGIKFNGTTLTKDFSDVGYIIKEAGNQGAHPDKDPDLIDFTQKDAEDLQKIFMELVGDLFVVPESIKKSKADFLQRRKIKIL